MANTYDLSDIKPDVAPKAESGSKIVPGNDTVSAPVSEKDIEQELEQEKKYGSSPLAAGALGAADMATLGLAPQALEKTGLVSSEAQKQLKERNPIANAVGQGVGLVGPLLAGPEEAAVGAAAKYIPLNAVTKAGDAAAKLVEGTGRSTIARKIAAQAAKGGVEGGAFGVGNLLSENALGDADLNGENLVSSVGVGAALGGGLGGLIGAASSAAPAIGRGVSAIKNKVAEFTGRVLEPGEASLEYANLTKKQAARLESLHPDVRQVLPEIMSDAGVTIGSSAKQDLDRLTAFKADAGTRVGAAMKTADAHIAETMPEIIPKTGDLYKPMLEELNKKYITPNQNLPTMRPDIAPIKTLMKEFSEVAMNNQPTTLDEMFQTMKRISDKAKYDKTPGQIRLVDSAYRDVRNYLRTQIDSTVDKVAAAQPDLAQLGTQLKRANKEYSVLSDVLPRLATKDKAQLVDITSILKTIKNYATSDHARKAVILSDIQKVGDKVNGRIQEGVSNFANKTFKASRPLSTKVLVSSSLSNKYIAGKGEQPKNAQEAYTNMKNNLQGLADQPDTLVTHIAKATAAFHDHAPDIADSTQATVVRGVQFLQSKMPTSPSDGQFDSSNMFSKPYQPSKIELAKFERYLQAVESPLSTLDDLENGTLTREHVEALQAVYPQMYDKIRQTAMDETTKDHEHPISYTKRVQLGTLLGIDTDPSLVAKNIAGLQGMFSSQNEQKNPQQGQKSAIRPNAKGAANISIASRAETPMQQVNNRRNG